jgi:glycosyltransferase involved in cell wall biosynthesis
MTQASTTHLVLIPSYNPGARVYATVRAARAAWTPVWIVVDGSTDGSAAELLAMARSDSGLRVFVNARNRGKGAAILCGLQAAAASGFTHALTMDSDGQHPADAIRDFMAVSARNVEAMVLGVPIFPAEAPRLRVEGRKISNWWVELETGWAGIGDSLFGFRVYPIAPLLAQMQAGRWMRRFDFDAEAAVRLSWRGVPAINRRVPVRYFGPGENGVSHFHYWRDNVLLTWMHLRLLAGAALRLPRLLARSRRRMRSARKSL